MSQALTILFYEGKERVASVYLRWSAYTIPTYIAAKQAVYILDDRQVRQRNLNLTDRHELTVTKKHICKGELSGIKDVRLKLIRAYEKLGGGLDPKDRTLAEKLFPGEQFSQDVHSSYGLVSVSDDSMQESEDCACGLARIYIDRRMVETGMWMDAEEGCEEEPDADSMAKAYTPQTDVFSYPFEKAYSICRNLIRAYKNCPNRYLSDGKHFYTLIV